MTTSIPQLDEVLLELQDRKTIQPVSVRNFLSWFDIQRRSRWNIEYINATLAEAGLRTVPDYLEEWIDGPITFELISDHPAEDANLASGDRASAFENVINVSNEDGAAMSYSDPSFKIGRIQSATRSPVCVAPNSSLKEAMTIMLAQNFSQLPVMDGEDVKGVVSWTSIGTRFAQNISGEYVSNFMNPHEELRLSASLFQAIQIIREHNYVLTRAADGKLTGIVTASDIALEFEQISTPFLLLAEIENSLRLLIDTAQTTHPALTLDDIKAACGAEYLKKGFSKISDLTFGNCVYVFRHQGCWEKLGLYLDQNTICTELEEVRKIRNEVMHFDTDPLSDDRLLRLRNLSRMFDQFRRERNS